MEPFEQELTNFLESICVDWGFCSMAPEERASLAKSQQLNAHDFAIAVLKSEGFDPPEAEVEWMRRLKNAFIDRFGAASVSAEGFESDGTY